MTAGHKVGIMKHCEKCRDDGTICDALHRVSKKVLRKQHQAPDCNTCCGLGLGLFPSCKDPSYYICDMAMSTSTYMYLWSAHCLLP